MRRDTTCANPAFASADVVPFPARLRTGKIARTAETLTGSTPKASAYYWRQTVATMRRQMERAGFPDEIVDAEVRVFVEAVRAEILRRTCGQPLHILENGEIA